MPAPVADVGGDRAVQQGSVLRDHADLRAQLSCVASAQILPVDQDAAARPW
jgi:hypothetical protein